jgi:hypothetical protein
LLSAREDEAPPRLYDRAGLVDVQYRRPGRPSSSATLFLVGDLDDAEEVAVGAFEHDAVCAGRVAPRVAGSV